jgi:heavy metal translocating P-type ATPase
MTEEALPYAAQPLLFEEYFQLGEEETLSPFLTITSKTWGKNLLLKAALLASVLLAASFTLSFYPNLHALSTLLLMGVYFFAGTPSLIESIEDLAAFQINIDVLMTFAAFGSVLIGSPMEGGLLLVLFSLSGAMEDAVTTKAKSALSSLHKLSPSKATVVEEGGFVIERSVKDIPVDTKILIRSGEMVPLDGVVIQGISSVNMVHLTGESLPITKQLGDVVPAGARNLEGALTLKVTHTSADSTLSKIIQLVTQAQEARPRLQQWFDRLSKGYATTIICLFFFFSLIFPFLLNIPFLGIEGSIYRSLAFLIAASPCALIIAIPIAYLSTLSICAKKGILVKGGITLDALSKCSIIAFDKTGTLTTGQLTCLSFEPLQPVPYPLQWPLAVALSMEMNAIHPIAKAITNYAEQQKITPYPLTHYALVPGYGLEAQIDGPEGKKSIYIGSPAYITSKRSDSFLDEKVKAIQGRGEILAVMLFGDDLFLFRFSDTLRPHIQETLSRLTQSGRYRPIMLTGDHFTSAKRIADELNIKEFYADLKPEDKLHHVSQLAQEYGLAMVGDGINDAPALARATVGICMGKVGSTAAVDASDVVLLQDDIQRLDWLLNKAAMTQNIVRQNLFLAVVAIIAASLPALGGFVPLWLAVIVHEGGTVLVGLNALRLLGRS